VSAGYDHTCAVTTGNRAYCWGLNVSGELGDGTSIEIRLTPTPVAGTRAFRQISAGWFRTCALTTSTAKKIYCWGTGILGNGTGPSVRRTPQLVSGTHSYRQVAVENDHACAVSTTYKVLCWGSNRYGQLGSASSSDFVALTPVAAAGTRQFLQVSVGLYHTCAVTTADKAFCWGFGRNGAVGDGRTYNRFEPRAVAGGLSFERVSAGRGYTCGETPGDRAYCWGVNDHGELGTGTLTGSLTPKAVSGGLFFKQVDAGGFHTCGVASGSSAAWCWGYNADGQLGNGITDFASPSPSRVQ
jgi:alpha-tubulin suppressor-like RCC1 family protein